MFVMCIISYYASCDVLSASIYLANQVAVMCVLSLKVSCIYCIFAIFLHLEHKFIDPLFYKPLLGDNFTKHDAISFFRTAECFFSGIL